MLKSTTTDLKTLPNVHRTMYEQGIVKESLKKRKGVGTSGVVDPSSQVRLQSGLMPMSCSWTVKSTLQLLGNMPCLCRPVELSAIIVVATNISAARLAPTLVAHKKPCLGSGSHGGSGM